jgi:S1-C subfamily serine protease
MKTFLKTIFVLVFQFHSKLIFANTKEAILNLIPDEKNTIEIFSRVSPAVVFINTSSIQRSFFTLDVSEVPEGSGSGFLWDANGFIVTNHHVIQGAKRILVTLGDKTVLQAKVIGADPSVDVAVIKIEAKKTPFVTLGDSSKLIVGQKVLAIGNPFGLDRTLTTGVVSALGREIDSPNRRKIRDVVQTDAPINPGNSGGPLLNSSGQVIGMNTSIYSPSGASAGIGFAVPINTLKRVVPQLMRYGKVIRPSFGITMVNDHVAQKNGIEGVVVGEVFSGGPAAKAGMRELKVTASGEVYLGDVVTGIEKTSSPGEIIRVRNTDDLFNALESCQPGEKIKVRVKRDGTEKMFVLRLEVQGEE